TIERTTLGRKAAGDEVNVEPALRAGEPLGGHIVQGHVDGVGSFRGELDGLSWFDAPREIVRYCVVKGSIAVDGTSLTVAAIDESGFSAALVPHTLEATTLGALAPGDAADLENEGDLTIAAQFATPEAIAFMAKEGRGLICLCLTGERCDALGLRMMTDHNETPYGTAFTVSIESRAGISTGISAHD